jgi:hypothetical protein
MNDRTRATTALWRVIAGEWGTVLFVLVALQFFVGAFGLRGRSGYFPMGVSIVTIVFGLSVLVLSVLAARARTDAPAEREGPDDNAALLSPRAAATAAWYLFAFAATYLFGIVIGCGVASAAYFAFLSRVRPLVALTAGVGSALFIWIVFGYFAGLPLYRGSL